MGKSLPGEMPSIPDPATPIPTEPHPARVGVVFAVAAYGFWGAAPVYFKAVSHVEPGEILAHRIIWSVVFLLVLTMVRRDWRSLVAAMRNARVFWTLCLTTVLIAGNWFTFIWSVKHGQVMQASLGYYINPLGNVLLGYLFLRERLRGWQIVAVVLAGLGVAYLTIAGGEFPLLGLIMATTFGFYGLLRKLAPVGTLNGLTVETSILMLPAMGYLGWLMSQGQASFGAVAIELDILLMAAGVITALPLLWFAAAARRLTLTTLGFIQYLAPTGHFIVALSYGEPFTLAHGITFACIWAALVIYSIDAAVRARPERNPASIPSIE